MGNIAGLQRHVFPHPHQSQIKEVPGVLFEQADIPIYCSSVWRGHSPVGVHKGGQPSHPLGHALQMFTDTSNEEQDKGPRSLECDSGQIVQTQTSNSNRVVPISAGVQSLVLQMGPATNRPFCNPVQSQTLQFCVTSTGSNSLGSRRSEPPMGKPGCLCLSTSLSIQPGSFQGDGPRPSENDTDCTGVGQHALVLGSGQSIGSDSIHAPTTKGSRDTALNGLLHRNLKNLNLHAWLLEPLSFRNKVSLTKWERELRLRRDSQPELSINQSRLFLSSCVSQTRWTSGRPP